MRLMLYALLALLLGNACATFAWLAVIDAIMNQPPPYTAFAPLAGEREE